MSKLFIERISSVYENEGETALDELLNSGACKDADCWICETKKKARAEVAEMREKLAAYEATNYGELVKRNARLEAVVDAARDVEQWMILNKLQFTAHGRYLSAVLAALDMSGRPAL